VVPPMVVVVNLSLYLGVNHFYETHPDLESLIRSTTYLMRGAIFRSKKNNEFIRQGLSQCTPIAELIDMFHTHEATKPVDRVYALLGMSSDDPSTGGLLPDYKISCELLFKKLVKFLFCNQVFLKAWADEEIAVIKSKGCILGQMSVESVDRYMVNIKNIPERLGYREKGTLSGVRRLQ
jgi:hypothetical protein